MHLRRNPLIYEINTAVWLNELSERYQRRVTLSDVPTEVVDELASWGFDAIWMMGVWSRSPQVRHLGQTLHYLIAEYDRIMPGWKTEQVLGSPFAVYRYEVDPRFGGRDALATFREMLRQRGIGLILDFVPNHVAIDHPWTIECDDCLVRGTKAEVISQPGTYFVHAENGQFLAHGRDPYFPAWTDTAQIDAFSESGRANARETLLDIASQCDGVRCDMAMLAVNRIFARTWHRLESEIPKTEYWQEVIPPVKREHPDFLFMAEVYWDMEAELISLGFDFCYDKRLYDRLRHESVHTVRNHLLAGVHYQEHLVRFTENHDEARALAAFGPGRSIAAAVVANTLPGAKLLHEGQFQGRQIKVPVQLGVRPAEIVLEEFLNFYHLLIDALRDPAFHDGTYMALGTRPILNNEGGYENVIAYAWVLGDTWRIVVVNYSESRVVGRVMLPNQAFAGGKWCFTDLLKNGSDELEAGEDLLITGLEVDLEAFGCRIFSVGKA